MYVQNRLQNESLDAGTGLFLCLCQKDVCILHGYVHEKNSAASRRGKTVQHWPKLVHITTQENTVLTASRKKKTQMWRGNTSRAMTTSLRHFPSWLRKERKKKGTEKNIPSVALIHIVQPVDHIKEGESGREYYP